MGFYFDILIMFEIYILLTLGLDLIVGFTGMLSIGHAAFYAVGAYAAALLSLHFGFSFFPATLVAMAAAGLLGAMTALPASRIRGDFLIIVTLGLGEIAKAVLKNWTGVTGGVMGLRNIPVMQIGSNALISDVSFFCVETVMVLLAFFMMWRIKRSAFGEALKGIRDDELSMKILGYNTSGFKIAAFFIGSALAGLAGSLFSFYRGYISPDSFGLETSVLVFCMCVIGGMGSVWGSIVGAVIFWSFPELMRLTGNASFDAGAWRQLILGIILVLVMVFRPRGILGERTVND